MSKQDFHAIKNHFLRQQNQKLLKYDFFNILINNFEFIKPTFPNQTQKHSHSPNLPHKTFPIPLPLIVS